MSMDPKEAGVLVVDDDKFTIELIAEVLNHAGYKQVYTARDGLECMDMLRDQGERIHVVLLDRRMPGMSGDSVIESVANAHTHLVGIILVTGYPSLDILDRMMNLEQSDLVGLGLLEKPFRAEELISRVDRAVRLIMQKRNAQIGKTENMVSQGIARLESSLQNMRQVRESVARIESEVARISRRSHSFIADLGLDMVRIILIAATVLAFMYFGLDDFLKSLLSP